MVARGWGWEKRGDVSQRVQASTRKMSKFWISNVQYCACCILHARKLLRRGATGWLSIKFLTLGFGSDGDLTVCGFKLYDSTEPARDFSLSQN